MQLTLTLTKLFILKKERIKFDITIDRLFKSIDLDRSVDKWIVINIDRADEIRIDIDRFPDNILELTLTLPLTGKRH